ncbi:eukaryotic translation initiation factor 4E-binding protein [Anabrus simplex]|uniref:eukaryotic translation initiation factor 4E-binding protein n=1 Tax=Anabrus simplex TaxID=316456 RepID=UPI0034DD0F1A
MSASPVARQATQCQTIPSRRVMINDPSQLPIDYSSTPGGTLYSTTPGGTRIVYERAFLMQLRNSPIARTPPKNIPSILIKGVDIPSENGVDIIPPTKKVLDDGSDEGLDQFQLEI